MEKCAEPFDANYETPHAEGAVDLIMRKLWHRDPLEISTKDYVVFKVRELMFGYRNAITQKKKI